MQAPGAVVPRPVLPRLGEAYVLEEMRAVDCLHVGASEERLEFDGALLPLLAHRALERVERGTTDELAEPVKTASVREYPGLEGAIGDDQAHPGGGTILLLEQATKDP